MKMRRQAAIVAMIAAAAAASAATAAITVRKAGGDLAAPEEATITLNALTGGWEVVLLSLYEPGGETIYEIHADGGERIDDLFIDVPCLSDADGNCAPAGSPVFVHVRSDAPLGISRVDNIEQRGTAETLLLTVDVRGSLGSVTAEVIGTVIADGDITGPIVSTTPDNSTRGVYWVEAHGSLLGDVRAENGRIGRVWAWGDIGAPGAPVTLAAKHKINGIFAGPPACVDAWLAGGTPACDGRVYADVDTHVNGGSGGIVRLFAGSFDGALRTANLKHDVFTGLPGRMTLTEALNGALILDGPFTDPQQSIETGAAGLHGQIIFNASGAPGPSWTGPVHVGAPGPSRITLNAPGYAMPAVPLGGGAVGVPPFDLHGSACTPPRGGTTSAAGGVATIRLRHYGPVGIGGPAPIAIGRRPDGSRGAFTALPAGAFAVTAVPSDANSVDVQGPFAIGYEYRILATADLRSVIPGASAGDAPPVAWSGDYRATIVAAPCPGDVDGNHVIDVVDLVIVLSNWGSRADIPADVNDSGVVNLTDLLIVLANWGACP
jgi:hypothetical protein